MSTQADDYKRAAEAARMPDGSISASRFLALCDAADRARAALDAARGSW